MTVTVQNLRAFVSGVEPDTLLPGQLCFNVVDKVVYVGDGSAYKTLFDGSFVAGVPGGGWYAMPMDFNTLKDFFVANPSFYGDIPTDNQVLTWSSSLGHPIWTAGGGAGGQVYTVTNNQVAIAPGTTVSQKIINATGVASPDEGDMTIVTGQPGEVYQGLYVFTTEWVRVASYANPTAAQVTYDNSTSGLPAITVQQAVDELNTDVIGATAIANTANATALAAQTVALAALPKAGGTMTGTITFAAGQTFPISGIQIASASQLGVVQGSLEVLISPAGVMTVRPATTGQSGIVQLNDTTTSTSVTQALTAAQGKNLQDQINSLGLAGNTTLAGTLNAATGNLDSVTADGFAAGFVNGNPLPSPALGNVDYYVIVTVPGSYNPPGGGGPYNTANGDWFLSNGTVWQFLGVGDRPAYASTTSAGVVQLATNADVQAGLNAILAVTPSSLQSKVSDVVNLTSSTTIASSTAVKTAYDLAGTMLPKAGGTMTGTITFAAGQLFPITGIQDATTAQKGVVQVGSNINVIGGTISVPQGSTGGLGVLQVGSNIDVDISGVISVALATTSDVGVVQAGTNINVDPSGVISVNNASTTQPGVVQLNDTTTSTSVTEALTANQGKQLQDQINALVISSNLTFGGTIDGSTGLMLAVTAEALAKGFTVGNPMVAASAADEFFTIVTVPGTMTPPGGSAQAVNDGDWWLSDGTNWVYLNVGYSAPYATTTAPGVIQLATNAEVQAGVESTHAVVPSSLQSKMSDATNVTSSTTIASSTAVKAAYDLAAASIPCSSFTTSGDLLVATGAGTYVALPVGTTGQGLVVDPTCVATGGLKWGQSLTGYTCSATPFNTALGGFAGDSITTGTSNTFLGYNAGTSTNLGDQNVAIGAQAALALTTGGNNVAVGFQAMDSLTTGSNNVAVGTLAYNSGNATGVTAVGFCAAASTTTASSTTAIGFCSLRAQTTGLRNTAVGGAAGAAVTTGTDNTFIGYVAGCANTGTGSTVVGSNAGSALTLGGSNVLIGAGAGDLITTGFNNTIIGDVGGSTSLVGNLILAAGTTVKFQANNSGAWSYDGTNYGTAGQFLASQGSTATPVWCTLSLACVPCSAFTACGTLLVGTGASTFTALPTGTNGQYLVVDTACTLTGGLKWNTFPTIPPICGYTDTSTPFNTAIGSGAGDSITTGTSNVSVGFNAGTGVTTGLNNTLIGRGAGGTLSGSSEVTAVGFSALALGTATAGQTTAVGAYALQCLTSGSRNTAVGYNAAGVLTTGNCNTAIGYGALDTATAGTDNTAVGQNALTAVTTGNCNTAVGSIAASALTTGNDNVAVGYGALVNSSTGSCNIAIGRSTLSVAASNANTAVGHRAGINVSSGTVTAIGSNALATVSTGTANTALGINAGSAYTGSRSVFIGHNAGDSATTGNSNVFIGPDAGGAVTIGIRNILIGDTAGDAITAGSNNTIIGDVPGIAALADNLILAAGTTVKLQVNENGAVGVGPTPSYGSTGQLLASAGTGAPPAWTWSLPEVPVPPTSTSGGVQGQVSSDSTYFYFYTGGRWQRIAWDTTVW